MNKYNPFENQVDGTHYIDMAIQPVEYIHKNGIGFIEGAIIKYVSRWRAKGGLNDLRKARHFIELLMEMEKNPPKDLFQKEYECDFSTLQTSTKSGDFLSEEALASLGDGDWEDIDSDQVGRGYAEKDARRVSEKFERELEKGDRKVFDPGKLLRGDEGGIQETGEDTPGVHGAYRR